MALVALFLIASILFLKKRFLPEICLSIIIFLFGALCLAQKQLIPKDSVIYLMNSGSRTICLKGNVDSENANFLKKRFFLLKVSRLVQKDQEFKVSGHVFVRLYNAQNYFYGDEVIVRGTLFKYRGRPVVCVKNKPGALIFTGRKSGWWLKALALASKDRMKKVIVQHLPHFSASILSAMVLGDGSHLAPFVKTMMVKTGTWHVVVVSGSHTVFVAFVLFVVLKIFKIQRTLRILLIMGLLWIYCLITGACAPVVRATIMTEAFLLSFLIRRNPLFCNSLCLAALFILFLNPLELFNIGFQLSFLSIFFIVVLSPKIREYCLKCLPQKPVVVSLVNCFSVSCAAWLGTAPLIASNFGNVSLIAVAANMVIVPLATVVIAAGFALVVLGYFFDFLVGPLSFGAEFLIAVFLKCSHILSLCPLASFEVVKIPAFAVVFCYAALVVFALAVSHSSRS